MPEHKQGQGVAQNNQPNNQPNNPSRRPAQPQQPRQTPKQATENVRETKQEASTNKNERTGKAIQTEAQFNPISQKPRRSHSGQKTQSHGEHAGDNPGGKQKQERTNKQGNPNRSPTQPQQLKSKTPKPMRAQFVNVSM